MSSELPDYSFEQKERLARRIQKLKKQKYLTDIESIIIKHNDDLDITTNPHGKFMYFQDLKKETYYALEKYVRKILKLKTISETSDNAQYTSEIIKYSEDDDPFSNNPKLRYSNKERNLIKRKIYDRQINNQGSDSDSEINRFQSSTEDNNKNNENIQSNTKDHSVKGNENSIASIQSNTLQHINTKGDMKADMKNDTCTTKATDKCITKADDDMSTKATNMSTKATNMSTKATNMYTKATGISTKTDMSTKATDIDTIKNNTYIQKPTSENDTKVSQNNVFVKRKPATKPAPKTMKRITSFDLITLLNIL